jgi:hypothetical protein
MSTVMPGGDASNQQDSLDGVGPRDHASMLRHEHVCQHDTVHAHAVLRLAAARLAARTRDFGGSGCRIAWELEAGDKG